MRPLLLWYPGRADDDHHGGGGARAMPLPNPPDLPDIGSPASTVLNGTDEVQLGAMVINQLRGQNAILEDPEITEYLNALGSEARDPGTGWRAPLPVSSPFATLPSMHLHCLAVSSVSTPG